MVIKLEKINLSKFDINLTEGQELVGVITKGKFPHTIYGKFIKIENDYLKIDNYTHLPTALNLKGMEDFTSTLKFLSQELPQIGWHRMEIPTNLSLSYLKDYEIYKFIKG